MLFAKHVIYQITCSSEH